MRPVEAGLANQRRSPALHLSPRVPAATVGTVAPCTAAAHRPVAAPAWQEMCSTPRFHDVGIANNCLNAGRQPDHTSHRIVTLSSLGFGTHIPSPQTLCRLGGPVSGHLIVFWSRVRGRRCRPEVEDQHARCPKCPPRKLLVFVRPLVLSDALRSELAGCRAHGYGRPKAFIHECGCVPYSDRTPKDIEHPLRGMCGVDTLGGNWSAQ